MAANADTRYLNDPTRNAGSAPNTDARTLHDPTAAQGGGEPPGGLAIPVAMHHYKMLETA